MSAKMFTLLVSQIPEAIYFSLFMIYAKNIKEKRLLYILLMTIEYVILAQLFPFNVYFQILYTFISFFILKILYKEKAQITDIFTFAICSLILMIISAIMYFIGYNTYKNTRVCVVSQKIILFLFIAIFKSKLNNIQKLYKKLWNRNFNKTYKIKTTTFRALNVVVFNVMFVVINFGMLLCIFIKNGGV